MYDIKNVVKTNVIKTTEQKVFTYNKGLKTVNVSSNFDRNPTTIHTISVLKKGTNLNAFDKKIILPKVNYVKSLKQNCVKNLMRFFVIPEEVKEFYCDIFKSNEHDQNEDDKKFQCIMKIPPFKNIYRINKIKNKRLRNVKSEKYFELCSILNIVKNFFFLI